MSWISPSQKQKAFENGDLAVDSNDVVPIVRSIYRVAATVPGRRLSRPAIARVG